MKRICISFSFVILSLMNIYAQTTIEEINHKLDTRPYYWRGVDYMSHCTLPDSVKQKFLTALSGKLTPHLQDSLLPLTVWQKEQFLEQSKVRCKGDSSCIEQTFQEIIANEQKKRNNYFENEPVSRDFVLAAASWNILEAIPILENAIGNERYSQRAIALALAKFGNDSIKQTLLKKYTLSYLLEHTALDTINDKIACGYDKENEWNIVDGIEIAMYLKSKEMLINMLDLIYIRCLSGFCAGTCIELPYVYFVVEDYIMHNNYLRKMPNYEVLRKIYDDYNSVLWDLSDKKLNKQEKKELEMLLSTEYKTKIKEQIRDWIIENVNFE